MTRRNMPRIIKNFSQKAKNTLLLIYNKFWTNKMILPADWTKTMIILTWKPGKPTKDIESYRPITLTWILEKCLKKMILTRLKLFLEIQNLLAERKASFRNNMSTSNSLVRFVQYVKQGFYQRRATLQCSKTL